MKTWAKYPIAPVVGRNGAETQEIRDFIAATNGVLCVRVPLSRGKAFALVDREDWIKHELWRWNWCLLPANYANRRPYNGRVDGKHKYGMLYMHRLIAGAPDDCVIDHENHDTLDNRGKNLRPATQSQNMQNQSLSSRSTTGITGVAYYKKRGKFIAYIQAHGQREHLGYFETTEEAAAARRNAEQRLFGEFAYREAA